MNIFTAVKYYCILHGRVFVMLLQEDDHQISRPSLSQEVPHFENMSVQYTAIFHGYKNDYFQMKKCNIFLIFAQNIYCGYTLEPPQ